MTTGARERRRRADGERSRRAILETAARLATVEGLDGLSIGRLAEATGMSKSGLFGHFGSKEELQLATIDMAEEIFNADVLEAALAQRGLARVRTMSDRFLSHLRRGVFPGGCFFASAAAEMDTRPGRVRDRIVATQRGWLGLLTEGLTQARDDGELAPSADPDQLAFEINAMLAEANGLHLLYDDASFFDRARTAIEGILARATPS